MKAIVRRSSLSGTARAPPSKSVAQRLILASLLSSKTFTIRSVPRCDDVESAIIFVKAFNVDLSRDESKIVLKSLDYELSPITDYVNLRSSGTTYRIALGISATIRSGSLILDCSKQMRNRPILDLVRALSRLGAKIEFLERIGYPPVKVYGGLRGGTVRIRGDISSQYVSALMYAGIRSADGIEVIVEPPVVSRTYIRLTHRILKLLGGDVELEEDDEVRVYSYPSELRGISVEVPGDYALSAFIMAATALAGDEVMIVGFNPALNQADREVIEIMREAELDVKEVGDVVLVRESERPRGLKLSLRDNPDLVLPLAAIASFARGETVFEDVRHLAYKESNRIVTLVDVLRRFGVEAYVTERMSIVVRGVERTVPATIVCPDDHRIAMLSSCIGLNTDGDTIIEKAECVSKSWADYWDVLKSLGANVELRGERGEAERDNR